MKTPRKILEGVIFTVGVGLVAWAGTTLVDHVDRISRVEAQVEDTRAWRERVESKLDLILEHLLAR